MLSFYASLQSLRFKQLVTAVLCCLLGGESCCQGGEATLYRDNWGVPHIWADDYRSAGYALGQAQCQDTLQNVVHCLYSGVGRLAELVGTSALSGDIEARKLRHRQYSELAWPTLMEPARQLIEGYCDGVNEYLRTHPEELLVPVEPITPIHVLARQRALLMLSTTGIVKADAEASKSDGYHPKYNTRATDSDSGQSNPDEKGDVHPNVEPGKSNAWALAGAKTASGSPMLLIDPHWPSEGPLQLYESWLHVRDGLQAGGFAGVGTPLPALAVSSHAAWTFTAGGADSSDAYALEINPDNPHQYRFDGRWEDMRVLEETVRVRQADGSFQSVEVQALETRHGPVLTTKGGVSFAAAMGGYQRADCSNQLFLMATAKSTDEFRQALALDSLSYFNLTWATAEGDIGYVQTGQAPIRPDGFNWEKMIPGWTSESLYLGALPFAGLPQVENPLAGFLQNCNVAANVVTPGLTFTKADFPPNVLWGHYDLYRARGQRATELLTQLQAATMDDGERIAFDTYVPPADLWVPIILQAYTEATSEAATSTAVSATSPSGIGDTATPVSVSTASAAVSPSPEPTTCDSATLHAAVQLLGRWNRFATRDSTGATLFRQWRLACEDFTSAVGRDSFHISNTADVRRDALAALQRAVEIMQKNYGSIEIPWGAVKRLQRGNQQWPLSGDSLPRLGMDTLRATAGEQFNDQHQLIAYGGQCVTSLVTLSNPPQIRAVVAYGQSNKADSPHYADQAPIYSQEKMRTVPWTLEQLRPLIESQISYQLEE